jgi:hypothetical protein
LLTAEYQLGQLLAASVGKLLDQPRPKGVGNEYHDSSLPPPCSFPEFPASAVVADTTGPATTRSRKIHADIEGFTRTGHLVCRCPLPSDLSH